MNIDERENELKKLIIRDITVAIAHANNVCLDIVNNNNITDYETSTRYALEALLRVLASAAELEALQGLQEVEHDR